MPQTPDTLFAVVSQLLARQPKSIGNYVSASWPVLVGSLVAGICLAAIVLAILGESHRQRWQSAQQALAIADVTAIEAMRRIGIVAATTPALQRPESITSALQTSIDALRKNGEILWLESPDFFDATHAKEQVPESIGTAWSNEPNNYQRLKVTKQLDPLFAPLKQLTLIRRFSPQDIDGLHFFDWLLGIGLCSLSCGAGVWLTTSRYRRQQLLQLLAEWAKDSDRGLQASDAFPNTTTLQSIEPQISQIVRSASQSMHARLETVQQSAEQSARVMSAMPVGVVAFDPSLKLLFVNRAGRELLKLSEATQFGQSLVEVVRHPIVVSLIQQVSLEPQSQEIELELPLSKITLRLRAQPLQEPHALLEPTARNGVLLTITDETRLKQLENARRDFTANVSHELKTPLSAIKAYAETLLIGALEDADASRRFVERISEQANRLDILIRDLLHLTKLQSQPDKPLLRNLQLEDVLKTCLEEHRTIGLSKNVAIDASGVGKNCLVEADLESLRTVIGNLLSNAVRYNRPGGWIKVSTRMETNFVNLIVEDNGVGIPPEDLDRIFERFYRVEKARSQDLGGTGLGLAIVKHLVQAISADIKVRSVLGQGSAFELRLKRSTLGNIREHGEGMLQA